MCKLIITILFALLFSSQILYAQCVGGALAGSSFDNGNTNAWTAYDVAGDDSWKFNSNNAYMNGFGDTTDEDWLISPSVDLSSAINPVLNFMFRDRYAGPDLQVVYSTNYNGTSDPNLANWTILGTLADQSDDRTLSDYAFTEYDLSGIDEDSVYIAFLYTATGSGSGQAEEWQLDNICISAEIPTYYNQIQSTIVNGTSCKALKTQLHDLIKGHAEITYRSENFYNVLDFFCSYDTQASELGNPEAVLWDMYSDDPTTTDAYEYDCETDLRRGSTSPRGEGEGYNREHSFPSSWWGGSDWQAQYTDVHHLFPSDAYVNSKKSNFSLGKVGTVSYTSFNGTKVGTSINANSSCPNTVFEPIDEYKGDFARAYLYMAVRYEDKITDWETINSRGDEALSGDCYTVFEPCMLDVLLDWHKNDPVSAKEIARNTAAFRVQGNRNPFIDHPEYADYIWGTTSGMACNTATPRFFAPKVLTQIIDSLENIDTIANTEPFTAMGLAAIQNTGITRTNVTTTSTNGDTIIDWVLIELSIGERSNMATNIVYRRAALLQLDGDVVDIDGRSFIGFENVDTGNYYITVQRQNHLGVMKNMNFMLN